MLRFSDYLTAKIAFSLRRLLVMNSFLSNINSARTTTEKKMLIFFFRIENFTSLLYKICVNIHAHWWWSDGEHDDSHFELRPLKNERTHTKTQKQIGTQKTFLSFSSSSFCRSCCCLNMSSRYMCLVLFSSLLFEKCVSLWVIACLNHNHFGVIYIRNWQF